MTKTNLPFKVSETSIVIIKDLPVLQCEGCSEYLIEDAVFNRVEEVLAGANSAIELQIVRYAA
jgi:YgiT-type zinc finger domain-containing protein